MKRHPNIELFHVPFFTFSLIKKQYNLLLFSFLYTFNFFLNALIYSNI